MAPNLKCLPALIFFLAGFGNLFAQGEGKVIERNILQSKILNKEVAYSVYLPPGYQTSQRTYPVVYLLHGYTDDNTGWVQFGEINRYADKAISEGTIPPMIIVMPNADSSWYINSYDGKENYEDFFVRELIPSVEKQFLIKGTRAYRAVCGLSMGGYGALILAMKHPELFVASAPLSAAVFDDDAIVGMNDKSYDQMLGQLYGRGLKGKSRLTTAWYNNSVMKLAAEKSVGELSRVRYWIDCGDDDFLSKGNCELHILLSERKIPHEFRMRDGNHTWNYWRTGIVDALAFIGESFRR